MTIKMPRLLSADAASSFAPCLVLPTLAAVCQNFGIEPEAF